MNFSPANVLAGSFAVLLHAGVAGAFLMEWGDEPPAAELPDKTYFIPATIVNQNPHTVRQEREAAASRARQQRQRDEVARQRAREQAINEQKARELAEQQEANRLAGLRAEQLAAEKLAQEQREKEEAERKLKQEQERLVRVDDELQQLINAEIDAIEAVTDDERAMAYVGQIQADIGQNWSRPPSARNGMQTLLKVFLVPTGEVVDVSVLTSSGNDAFDRSAIQAVRKVRRFDVPRDPRLFEEKFREFEVLFRPEDLRL